MQDQSLKARLIIDYFRRLNMHYCLWFSEVEKQLGRDKAYELLQTVHKQTYDIQIKRLSKIFDFELEDNLPKSLTTAPDEKTNGMLENIALNWLANDGVWFQAVENAHGMDMAKRCNDNCWSSFSPFEAWSIKQLLEIPDNCGLQGLKQALQFRLYAGINVQEVVEETEDSFVFRMVNCRVQAARKRKNLPDYPCKSAGIVEYSSFATAIDSRIKTSCVACPPDEHPENWYCAWKFYL
jgi:hypothetical protein